MLRTRWDGPFTATASPSHNVFTLALPPRMQRSPTVNFDRPKLLHPSGIRLRARYRARGRRPSTRWSCCSESTDPGRHALPLPVARAHATGEALLHWPDEAAKYVASLAARLGRAGAAAPPPPLAPAAVVTGPLLPLAGFPAGAARTDDAD